MQVSTSYVWLARSNSHYGPVKLRRVRAPGLQTRKNHPLDGRVPSPGVPIWSMAGSLAATCGGDPDRPEDILLTPGDITPPEVSWPRLGHVLCAALGLHGEPATLTLPNTIQIGARSADGVPAILTIQVCRADFRHVVAELVARLQGPFILLAPTSNHFDAPCQDRPVGRAAPASADNPILPQCSETHPLAHVLRLRTTALWWQCQVPAGTIRFPGRLTCLPALPRLGANRDASYLCHAGSRSRDWRGGVSPRPVGQRHRGGRS